MPHRLAVVGVAGSGDARRVVFEVDQPDLGHPAAAVALPGAEVAGRRHVGEGTVGGDGAELAVGHRQLLRQAAIAGGLVELVETGTARGHAGGVEQGGAVGVPVDQAIALRVVGDAGGHATRHRYHVDVLVAVVVAGEGDVLAVGGEARKRLFPRRGREPPGGAAGPGDDPDVAGIDKGDVGRRDVGLTQHAGVDGEERGRQAERGEGEQGEKLAHGEYLREGKGGRLERRTFCLRDTGGGVLGDAAQSAVFESDPMPFRAKVRSLGFQSQEKTLLATWG